MHGPSSMAKGMKNSWSHSTRVDQSRRPEAHTDPDQCRYGEEPAHLSLGKDTDGGETADALQWLGHERSGYSDPGVSPTYGAKWSGAVPLHVMRPLDPASPWNRAILAVSAVAGIVGVYLTLAQDGEPLLAIEAAGSAFLSWALARELDPDRQAPAIILAVFGGAWALLGFDSAVLPRSSHC